MGLAPDARVAMVLPDGPETAAAFCAIAGAAACAPLNPAYAARDFEFYLTDLRASAVVVDDRFPSPAADVAVLTRTPSNMLCMQGGSVSGSRRDHPAVQRVTPVQRPGNRIVPSFPPFRSRQNVGFADVKWLCGQKSFGKSDNYHTLAIETPGFFARFVAPSAWEHGLLSQPPGRVGPLRVVAAELMDFGSKSVLNHKRRS
jgi:hypothetical protein